MKFKHIVTILILFLVFASNCHAMCAKSPMVLRNETNQHFAVNSKLFFSGELPRNSRKYASNNYVQDDRGNKITLLQISFNELKSQYKENEYIDDIIVFSPKQELKGNRQYTAYFQFKFFLNEDEYDIAYEYPRNATPGELTDFQSRIDNVFVDVLSFATNSERQEQPTENLTITSVVKLYDEREEVLCPSGPLQVHIFKTTSVPKSPFYLLKITHLDTSVIDKILVKRTDDNEIQVYYGACYREYYFQPGEAYSIQAAPVNFAGQVGPYSKPFEFNAAKPPNYFLKPYNALRLSIYVEKQK